MKLGVNIFFMTSNIVWIWGNWIKTMYILLIANHLASPLFCYSYFMMKELSCSEFELLQQLWINLVFLQIKTFFAENGFEPWWLCVLGWVYGSLSCRWKLLSLYFTIFQCSNLTLLVLEPFRYIWQKLHKIHPCYQKGWNDAHPKERIYQKIVQLGSFTKENVLKMKKVMSAK